MCSFTVLLIARSGKDMMLTRGAPAVGQLLKAAMVHPSRDLAATPCWTSLQTSQMRSHEHSLHHDYG